MKPKDEILKTLETRFEKNRSRHPAFTWAQVGAKLAAQPKKVAILAAMEASGGEPDVVVFKKSPKEIVFVDCAAESPGGRRSLCYDQKALDARKENKPKGSAQGLAKDLGIEMLTEEEYRELQACGPFDLKTSSWVVTPDKIRSLGGALFGDRRYDQVFTYHNGADSYYGARGFRGRLTL